MEAREDGGGRQSLELLDGAWAGPPVGAPAPACPRLHSACYFLLAGQGAAGFHVHPLILSLFSCESSQAVAQGLVPDAGCGVYPVVGVGVLWLCGPS